LQWYNVLREAWGLEALAGEPEDSESLVYADFIVRQYKDADEQEVTLAQREYGQELEASYPGEAGPAVSELWRYISGYGKCETSQRLPPLTLIAENAAGEFAGFISAVHCPKPGSRTAVLNALIVKRAYRGLGIGKELVEKQLTALREQDIRWVFIVNPFIPETFVPFLLRCGFERKGQGFMLDLVRN
jgi:ribosomal protein S18 acetylase RimI-like enzyme